jgi:hypothetical protein
MLGLKSEDMAVLLQSLSFDSSCSFAGMCSKQPRPIEILSRRDDAITAAAEPMPCVLMTVGLHCQCLTVRPICSKAQPGLDYTAPVNTLWLYTQGMHVSGWRY